MTPGSVGGEAVKRDLGIGLQPVGLVARNAPDYVRRFYAIVESGRTVVPLRTADDVDRIEACGLEEVIIPEDGSGWIGSERPPAAGPEIAQIAFTSGTQGEPKGVLLTRANLANAVDRIVRVMGIDSSIREYVGVPVHHSFGFGRCRVVASVGGAAYLPANGFNIGEIRDMLERGEINAISAVPTLWRTALRHRSLLEPVADRVRWIEIGSQPMSRDEKLAMRALFPEARIVQHYGLTEASRSTFLDVSKAPAEDLETVGAPNGDVEVGITDEGRIRIRGGHVASELLIGGRRVSNTDAAGWFVTGDLGRLDGPNLVFLGRADDMINSGGIKLSADHLEGRLTRALGVSGGVAVARIPDAQRGDGILVAAREDCTSTDAEIRAAAGALLREDGVNASTSLHIMRVAALPVTDTGKVRRNLLAETYAQRRAAEEQAQPAPPARQAEGMRARLGQSIPALGRLSHGRRKSVRGVFESVFPGVAIGQGDSFTSLGGDSLSFVELSVGLEAILGPLPADWHRMSLADLEAVRPQRRHLTAVDTTLFLRFVGIVAVVTGHFTTLPVAGATFLLLIVAGYNFSRFQVETVLARASSLSILLSAGRIALPLFLVVFLIEAKQNHFEFMDLALLGNFEDQRTQQLTFWFVQVLVQILVLMAALLAVPSVRRLAATHPFATPLGLTVLATGIALAGPSLWDTGTLYDRVPHMLFWMFALGWMLHRARDWVERLVSMAAALALPVALWDLSNLPFWVGHGPLWIWVGCVLLIGWRTILVPQPIGRLAYYVGGASMFIYITHWSTHNILHRIAPVEVPGLDVVVAIAVGVLVWRCWDTASAIVFEVAGRRSRRRSPAVSPEQTFADPDLPRSPAAGGRPGDVAASG
jgi:acyl-coenzyme A synthetase/AMP-(fatty) acid ligase